MDLRVLGLLTGSINLAAVDLAFPFLITVICNLMSCGGRGAGAQNSRRSSHLSAVPARPPLCRFSTGTAGGGGGGRAEFTPIQPPVCRTGTAGRAGGAQETADYTDSTL